MWFGHKIELDKHSNEIKENELIFLDSCLEHFSHTACPGKQQHNTVFFSQLIF